MKKIVIVGLTNVGKSTLFNRLTGRNLSIEFDEENTTTDYISCEIFLKLEGGETETAVLYDTAGLNGVGDFETATGKMILHGDLILYVINVQTGLLVQDLALLKYLRLKGKKIILLVNKSDLKEDIDLNLFRRSGVEEILKISAKTSDGFDSLFDLIGEIEWIKLEVPLIGIIGRCNSGKSTLFNAILGRDRVITSDIFGSTRDSISEKSGNYCFMDTAGFNEQDEVLNKIISKKRDFALKTVDGVIVVLDGATGLTKTDKIAIDAAEKYGKFMVIIINKKDCLTAYTKETFKNISKHSWVPIVYTCGIERDLGQLFYYLLKSIYSARMVIKTSELNKMDLEKMSSGSGPVRLKYITQISSWPLVFKCFSNRPMGGPLSRYVKRRLAEEFKIVGAHIIVKNETSDNPYIKK